MRYFLILMFVKLMFSEYKLMSVHDMKLSLELDSKTLADFSAQLPYSNAYVYYLKSGAVFLAPNSRVDTALGLWFASRQVFDRFTKEGHYPIENPQKTVEEKFQKELVQPSQTINQILSIILPEAVEKRTYKDSLSAALMILKEGVRKKTASEQDNFRGGLVLGEYLRIVNKGNWVLLKVFGAFNSYYTIGILYPDDSFIILREVLNLYFDNAKITPETFVNLPFIKAPQLKFKNLPKSYFAEVKILSR